jgi:hypothetical protein
MKVNVRTVATSCAFDIPVLEQFFLTEYELSLSWRIDLDKFHLRTNILLDVLF